MKIKKIRLKVQIEDAISHARQEGFGKASGYFKDHPIIYENFEKWIKKQDSVPNREEVCALLDFFFTLICRNLQKPDRIHAQVHYGKFWEEKSLYFRGPTL